MSHFFGLTDFLGNHPEFAFAAVLLLALSEALPVIGTYCPGFHTDFGCEHSSNCSRRKTLDPARSRLRRSDCRRQLGILAGHQFHREFCGWPLNRFPGLIERSAQFVRRHGVLSVFLARFTAVVRAFVPLVAGILRMSSQHFLIANVLSALVWAPLHVYPGVVAGLAISVAGRRGAEIALISLVALIVASIIWHLLKKQSRPIPSDSASVDLAAQQRSCQNKQSEVSSAPDC